MRRLHLSALLGAGACSAFLAAAPYVAEQQRPRFAHLGVEDGLSNTWVRSILKDYRGFLWLATPDGLNRYDGNGFVYYRHEPEDPRSLRSSEVWALFEDSRRRLWVSAGGLHVYDRELDRFERRPLGEEPEAKDAGFVRAICEDRQGQLWVGTRGGLYQYDPETRVATRFLANTRDLASGANGVMSLAFDRRGRLWVGSREGLYLYDQTKREFVRFLTDLKAPERHVGQVIESIFVDQTGTLWMGTWGWGLVRFDPETGRAKQYLPDARDASSISDVRVLRVSGDGGTTIYAGLEHNGLDVLDTRSGTFTHCLPDPEDPSALTSASVWALDRDDQGILWVGTYNGGLDYYSPFEHQFGLLRARRGGLSDPHVAALMEDHRGALWIGTDGGGLNRLDRKSGQMTYYRHDPLDPRSLSSNAVLALVEDHRREIWIGTWAGGLVRLDPRTGHMQRFRREPGNPAALASDNIRTLFEDRRGNLLIGEEDTGAQVLDPARATFTSLAEKYPGVPRAGSVRVIVEDAQGNLWLGRAADGQGRQFDAVERIDRESGRVTVYRHDPNDPDSLGPGIVYAIHEDVRGNVWVGTAGGGLSCLKAGSRQVRRYTTRDGLPSDVVNDILEDRQGNLWLSTTRGLARVTDGVHVPDRPRILVFDENDGLQGAEFRSGAALKTRGGELFFGGQRGVSFFYPESIRQNPYAPRVLLTDLRVFNKSAKVGAPGSPLQKAITETEELVLSHRESVVTFEFAALSYTLPRKNEYAYKLDGFEPAWNQAGNQHTATYTNLPHGRYTFRVRASNNDGLWNDEGLALGLYVMPRWYERRTVQLLLALLAALLVAGGYRWRVGQLRAREREVQLRRINEELEGHVASRTAELEAEKERLAVTLRSIGDGVVATDVTGQVALMNRVAENLTGWSLDEARGRPLREILSTLDRERRTPRPDPVQLVLATGSAQTFADVSVLVRRDGSELLISDSVAPIRDQRSVIVGAVLVLRDVTERRQMEDRLQNAQKLEALGILAGGIAHDFKNLLPGVFGYVDIAQKQSTEDQKVATTLSKALSVLERARGLTNQLLTFSRAGQPVTKPLSLAKLLENGVRFALSGSNVSCDMRIAADLWPCEGDERQIDQVIDNLLLNARQALPGGGTITLTADNVTVPRMARIPVPPGRYVRVTVHDEGAGILPDVLPRIFEPFFTTKASGTGLGLATTFSVVRKHGGHIEVESAPGSTTFSVYLPASEDSVGDDSASPPGLVSGGGRVLVLDDEEYVRDVAREMLEGLGHVAETVVSGEQAITAYEAARAASRPFDLVILDLTIPGGIGGVAVLSRLREIDPGVLAVASSGYSSEPVMASPESHGFAARLTKPYTIADMAEVVSRVLGPRRK